MQNGEEKRKIETLSHVGRVYRYAWILAIIWTVLLSGSLTWNYRSNQKQVEELGVAKAVTAFEWGRIFRSWVSRQGGIYVAVSQKLQPNPILSHVAERDIVTPSGRQLTKMNSAFMAHEVFDSIEKPEVLGKARLVSLKPLNPQNSPDAWEEAALRAFENGVKEVSEEQTINGRRYMRLLRVSVIDKSCLECHASQGYSVGDVKGGVGVVVPISDIIDSANLHMKGTTAIHGVLWLFGLGLIGFGARKIRRGVVSLAANVSQLEAALSKVKLLEGIIPICCKCKKIRNDSDGWEQMETYITEHSDATFSHGLCPDCYEKSMDDLDKIK